MAEKEQGLPSEAKKPGEEEPVQQQDVQEPQPGTSTGKRGASSSDEDAPLKKKSAPVKQPRHPPVAVKQPRHLPVAVKQPRHRPVAVKKPRDPSKPREDREGTAKKKKKVEEAELSSDSESDDDKGHDNRRIVKSSEAKKSTSTPEKSSSKSSGDKVAKSPRSVASTSGFSRAPHKVIYLLNYKSLASDFFIVLISRKYIYLRE